jgi:ribosomal protein S18 acetylase RimI-like enzyme
MTPGYTPPVSEVVVKRLGPGDEAEAQRFDAAFDQTVERDLAARYLADERHHLVAAYIDGEPAGVATATEILRPDKPPELFLNELGVIPAFRRRGVAGALMAEIKRLAGEGGCVSIWVLTEEDNEGGVATYRAAGGRRLGRSTVMFEIDPAE